MLIRPLPVIVMVLMSPSPPLEKPSTSSPPSSILLTSKPCAVSNKQILNVGVTAWAHPRRLSEPLPAGIDDILHPNLPTSVVCEPCCTLGRLFCVAAFFGGGGFWFFFDSRRERFLAEFVCGKSRRAAVRETIKYKLCMRCVDVKGLGVEDGAAGCNTPLLSVTM